LDIGFGLAGAAIYLAKKYRAQVTGLEINPRMVSEATKKTQGQIKTLLNFLIYQDFPKIPCFDHEFDVAYSKGVLVHLQDKQEPSAARTLTLFIFNSYSR
jgi:ubiquinone/menaquinone biosynthesis C-methylase UbiE